MCAIVLRLNDFLFLVKLGLLVFDFLAMLLLVLFQLSLWCSESDNTHINRHNNTFTGVKYIYILYVVCMLCALVFCSSSSPCLSNSRCKAAAFLCWSASFSFTRITSSLHSYHTQWIQCMRICGIKSIKCVTRSAFLRSFSRTLQSSWEPSSPSPKPSLNMNIHTYIQISR